MLKCLTKRRTLDHRILEEGGPSQRAPQHIGQSSNAYVIGQSSNMFSSHSREKLIMFEEIVTLSQHMTFLMVFVVV